jgi:NTE family protein
MKKRYRNYNLLLGGGGSRGLSHVSLISFLEKIKKPAKIFGCSIGAIIGAIYSIYADASVLKKTLESMLQSEEMKNMKLDKAGSILESYLLIAKLTTSKYLISYDKMREFLKKYIPEDLEFKDLKIKLSVQSFDLISGKAVFLDKGNVLTAVIASASIPGIVEPIKYENMLLTDGGAYMTVPYEGVSEKEISVVNDVNFIPEDKNEFLNGFDIFYRSVEWMNFYYEKNIFEKYKKKSNFLILKPDVGIFRLKDFYDYEKIFKKGDEFVKNNGKIIEKFLKKPFFFF